MPEYATQTIDSKENFIQSAEENPVQSAEETRRPERKSAPTLQTTSADLVKAHMTLLEKEVILAKQGDLFRLVNHHYYRLQTWHDQHTGWRIQRTSTLIRLIRHPSSFTPGYLYDRLKEPRDFACLVWILWYAENRQLSGRGNDQQFLLSQLADQVQEQSRNQLSLRIGAESEDLPQDEEEEASEGGFDFRRPGDRYSIQRALHYLEQLGALQLVDGQTREWVEQTGSADVLYEFTDVARSFVAALQPQVLADAASALDQPGVRLQPTRLPGAGAPPLLRAWRALLLGPALFKFDDAEAFLTLLSHADVVASELLDTFGWLLDIRPTYACVVHGNGSASGPITVLSPYATNDQIALLICDAMRERITSGQWPSPDRDGCVKISTEDMSELFYTVRERYGEHWGNEARGKSSPTLLAEVSRKMRQIGLLRGPDETGTLLILPLAARYSATYAPPGQDAQPTKARPTKRPKTTQSTRLPGMS